MKKPKKSKKTEIDLDDTSSPPDISSENALDHFELSGSEDKSPSINASETDDDEKEGSGDGKIGRSVKDDL